MNTGIVVGYDGSPSSAAAVSWAATEATLRALPLTLLSCRPTERMTTDARTMTRELAERHPELACDMQRSALAPGDALVSASRHADLLVVGKTGAGPMRSLLIGSVANAVMRHSHCPTALIPLRFSPTAHRSVVVGVDGSPAGAHALRWALGEAAVRHAEAHVIHAWAYDHDGPALEWGDRHEAAERAGRAFLDQIVSAAMHDGTCVALRPHLVEEAPASALLTASATADVVVVGSRGRSALRTLFGSVARAITEAATCPIVVVHPPHQPRDRTGDARSSTPLRSRRATAGADLRRLSLT